MPQNDRGRTIRLFLLAEGTSFALAAAVHAGVLVDGHRDPGAAIAESVIATVLLGAFALATRQPARPRAFGLAAQGFALLGTLAGTYLTAIVGLGTPLDVAYHLTILTVLVIGLFVTARAPTGLSSAPPTHRGTPT